MEIFILRHFESIKNTQVTFSSVDDKEELTELGIEQGIKVAHDLKEIIQIKKLKVSNIYCANSVRARQSSEIICKGLNMNVSVCSFNELLSTKSRELMGKTKSEVRKNNPLFMRELSLYDAGLFSSYNFHRDVGETQKRYYEKTVCECFREKIVNNGEDENAKIICLHNSSLTALVINIARRIANYPKDYYGKVIADNGNIFWIHCDEKRNEFLAANCESELLVELIRSGL